MLLHILNYLTLLFNYNKHLIICPYMFTPTLQTTLLVHMHFLFLALALVSLILHLDLLLGWDPYICVSEPALYTHTLALDLLWLAACSLVQGQALGAIQVTLQLYICVVGTLAHLVVALASSLGQELWHNSPVLFQICVPIWFCRLLFFFISHLLIL